MLSSLKLTNLKFTSRKLTSHMHSRPKASQFNGLGMISLLPLSILALCSGLALSSCSLFEALAKAPEHLIMRSEETKQGNEGSSQPNYLGQSYLNTAFSRSNIIRAQGKFLKLVNLSSNNNKLSRRLLLGLTSKGEVLLIDGAGRMVKLPIGGYDIQAAAFSPSTLRIAFAEPAGVHLIDLATGSEVAKLTKIRSRINSIDFDGAGDGVLIGGTDSKVYRWRYKNEREGSSLREREQALERYVGHTSVVGQVCFHPKGRVFFSADWRGRVIAWIRYDSDGFEGEYLTNAVSGRPFTAEVQSAKAAFQADGTVEALKLDEKGELLAVSSDKGELSLLMVRGFRPLAKIQAHSGLIYDLDYSADGKFAVTLGRDNYLKVWRIVGLDLDSVDPTEATWQLAFEAPVPDSYKVAIIDNDRVMIGHKSGEVSIVAIQPQLPVTTVGIPIDAPLPTLKENYEAY